MATMAPLRSHATGKGSLLEIARGSLESFEGDAVVLAWDEALPGNGTPGQADAAAKRARLAAADNAHAALSVGEGMCEAFGASGKTKWLILARGPDRTHSEAAGSSEILKSAYLSVVKKCMELQISHVGVCVLGWEHGQAAKDQDIVAHIAIKTLAGNLPLSGLIVTLLTSEAAETNALVRAFDSAFPPLSASLAELDLFKKLLRVRTVSGEGPMGSYREMADILVAELKAVGVDEVQTREFIPGKPVVVATRRGTDPLLDAVLLTSHYDVVPADTSKWTVDPWAAEEKEGRVYGRGAQDMKCVVTQHLCALKRLQGRALRRTIHITMLPDEEIGGVDGMLALVRSDLFQSLLPIGLAIDEGLANEGDAVTVFYGERVPMWVLINSNGPTGHGSRFVEGTAVEKLLSFTGKALAFRREQEECYKGQCHGGHEGCAHASRKKLGEVCTLNVTFLKAGVAMSQGDERVALNVVPSHARAGMDLRVPPSVPLADITEMLNTWAREAGVEWQFAPWTQPSSRHSVSSHNRRDNVLWGLMADALEALKVKVELEVFPAGTDSRYLREAGIQAMGFSPIRNHPILLHENDEWLSASEFAWGVDVFEGIVTRLCA